MLLYFPKLFFDKVKFFKELFIDFLSSNKTTTSIYLLNYYYQVSLFLFIIHLQIIHVI